MFGLPPQLIALLCIMFIALGIYNFIMARRRQQRNQLQGIRLPWYKQLGVLTGIEYVLLALTFLLNISLNNRWLPTSLNVIVIPAYLVILLSSGLFAGVVIYQGLINRPKLNQAAATTRENNGSSGTKAHESSRTMTAEERTAYLQRRRERRQKAAAARRRRTGKA